MSAQVCTTSEEPRVQCDDRAAASATVERVEVCVLICKRGHWIEADPCGVMCPFCGAWENLPEPICPNHDCGALLEGVVYQRDLRKRRNAS